MDHTWGYLLLWLEITHSPSTSTNGHFSFNNNKIYKVFSSFYFFLRRVRRQSKAMAVHKQDEFIRGESFAFPFVEKFLILLVLLVDTTNFIRHPDIFLATLLSRTLPFLWFVFLFWWMNFLYWKFFIFGEFSDRRYGQASCVYSWMVHTTLQDIYVDS